MIKNVLVGDVSDIIMGQAPPGNTSNFERDGTVFVKVGEFGVKYPIVREWTTKPLKKGTANDVFICVVGATIGKINYGIDCAIGRSVAAIRPLIDRLDQSYLFYYLSTWTQRFRERSQGSAQGVLTRDMLYNLSIPLPPLPIQKKIAAILEKADATREKRRKANELTEQFLQSAFLEMFGDPVTNPKGWEMVLMKNLCDIKRGASPRPIDKWMGGTVPWIKIGDGSGKSSLYIDSTKSFVTEEGAARSVAVPKGSLIFANCGVSLGFARILNISGCIHDGWLALSNLREDLNNVFLLSVLNQLTNHFRQIAPGGTQPNLNTSILGNTKIPLPPFPLQNKFASIISKIENLRIKQKESEQELDNLFNSLMQKAFNGELVG